MMFLPLYFHGFTPGNLDHEDLSILVDQGDLGQNISFCHNSSERKKKLFVPLEAHFQEEDKTMTRHEEE